MSRISLSALAAGTLAFAALASPVAAQAPAAEHNDYSKAENWLCWPGRADACSGDNTSTVVTAAGKASKETWKADPKAPIEEFESVASEHPVFRIVFTDESKPQEVPS